jgi:hypothetical protein
MSDDEIGPGVDPLARSRIKSWRMETAIGKDDRLEVLVQFWDGGRLVLGGELGGQLQIRVLGRDAPQDLYEAARKTCHDLGMPWTDPRTGVTYDPPSQRPGKQE